MPVWGSSIAALPAHMRERRSIAMRRAPSHRQTPSAARLRSPSRNPPFRAIIALPIMPGPLFGQLSRQLRQVPTNFVAGGGGNACPRYCSYKPRPAIHSRALERLPSVRFEHDALAWPPAPRIHLVAKPGRKLLLVIIRVTLRPEIDVALREPQRAKILWTSRFVVDIKPALSRNSDEAGRTRHRSRQQGKFEDRRSRLIPGPNQSGVL